MGKYHLESNCKPRQLKMTFNILLLRWEGMLIRSTLAALDFNKNVNRGSKLDADGNVMYKMKVG